MSISMISHHTVLKVKQFIHIKFLKQCLLLLFAKSTVQVLIYFASPKGTVKQGLILPFFCKWGNWGAESLGHLHKVTSLVCGRALIWTQVVWFQSILSKGSWHMEWEGTEMELN